MDKFKVIISGGGTGGHVFPALAIADELKKTYPSTGILFVGAKGKMEMDRVPKAGYQVKGLWISGFQRKLSLRNLSFPFKLIWSLINAFFIIKKFKPNVAIGVGGYASGPLLYVSNMLGIPTLIQEQNSYPGITNKLLASKADKICVAYPDMERFFPKDKIVFTGNPMRFNLNNKKADDKTDAYHFFGFDKTKKTLVVTGGSLGARTLNEAVLNNISILEKMDNVQILWQVGKFYWEGIQSKNIKLNNIKIVPFIERMDWAYLIGDLFLCRAGALTISELSNMSKPAVFVPSPNVSEDHQTKNAEALTKFDAALLIKDGDISKEFGRCLNLVQDEDALSALSINISKFAKRDAAKDVVNEIIELVRK